MTSTRYYFTDATPAVTVTRDASWTLAATAPARSLAPTRPASSTTVAGATVQETVSTQQRGLAWQGIGAGLLTARTMTGSYALAFMLSENTSGADAFLRVVARVVSADGATVRGTLFTATETVEQSTSQSVRTMTGTLTPVTAQAGDRLVIEVGALFTNTNTLAAGITLTGGSYATGDLTAVDGSTTTGMPWVDIVLDDPPNPPTGLEQIEAGGDYGRYRWVAPAAGTAPTSYEVRINTGAALDIGLVLEHGWYTLTPATSYAVEVRAKAAPGVSAWAPLTLTTLGPPAPPTGLEVTDTTTTTLTVAWTPPAGVPAPTSYEVRVGGAVVDVGLATSHTVTELSPATSYTVDVRALSAGHTSSGAVLVSSWATITAATAVPGDYRPWLVSERLLVLAGLDPAGAQPAFVWQHTPVSRTVWETHPVRSRALMGWTITTGRTSPRDKVAGAVATITVAAWGEYAAAGLPQLGDPVRLALTPALGAAGIAAGDRPRFTGEVTDVSLDTRTRVLTVTAVGRRARALRRKVDGTAYPLEREGARVARILAAAGADAGTLDPGRLDLLPHPAAGTTADQLLDAVSDSTTGQLVERRDGLLDWHDADHRRDTPTALELDATELLSGFTWAQRVGDLTNVVTVRYGAGLEATVADDVSVAARGDYSTSLETLLPASAHAQAVAGLIVGRYGRPVWLLPAVALDLLRTLDPAELGAGVSLAHGSKLHLSGLPAGGPYTDADVFVEGVTETLTPRAWRLNLTVADQQLAGAPLRWRDVPGITWAGVRDGLRWLDVATITDPADLT